MARAHRILVADDDDMVRMVLKTVLDFQGYDVEEAADGEEVIAKFTGQEKHPDLVMVDQNMPGLSGVETLNRLRQLNPAVKAVLLSGGTVEDPDLESCSTIRYLPKPFVNDELIAMVRAMLDQAEV